MKNGEKGIVNKSEKTILYTGSLASRYGIKNLINSFPLINDKEYSLWICGANKFIKQKWNNRNIILFVWFAQNF